MPDLLLSLASHLVWRKGSDKATSSDIVSQPLASYHCTGRIILELTDQSACNVNDSYWSHNQPTAPTPRLNHCCHHLHSSSTS